MSGRSRPSGFDSEILVRDGDPRQVLLDGGLEAQVDLVVVGRTGAGGGPGFLHLGSVVEYLAHHATRPLAVIPGGAGAGITRIALDVDGSAEAACAAAWCGDVAATVGASVVAIAVDEPALGWTETTSADEQRRQVTEWAAPVAQRRVEVITDVKHGVHPVDGLLAASDELGADLLVIGARGVGGFSGLRAGGVALKVLHAATIPLALIPSA